MAGYLGPLMIVVWITIIVIWAWDAVWKAIALWKAGGNRDLAWFVCLFVFNTAGILPIIYIYKFSKKNKAQATITKGS